MKPELQRSVPELQRQHERTEAESAPAAWPVGVPGGMKTMLAALAVVVGVGGYLGYQYSQPEAEPPRTQQEIDAATQYWREVTMVPLVADVLDKDRAPAEIAKLKLPPEQAKALEKDVQSGQTRLLVLGFMDRDGDIDGDIVLVEAGGLHLQTPVLSGTPYFMIVPAPANGPVQVQVTTTGGDGDGAIVGGFGAIPMPFLTPGQTVTFTLK